MLNTIMNYAFEKYASDVKAADEFFDGFIKEAADLRDPSSGFFTKLRGGGKDRASLSDGFLQGFSSDMGKHFGSLSVGLAATAVGSTYGIVRDMNLHNLFLKALYRAVEGNIILKEAPKAKVMQYAETVFKFAPNVATDPNLLSSILANAIHGEGIDPMTIKTLTELESKYRDNTSFSPKTYV